MLVRSPKSAFLPSTLVFPGGRLATEDGSPDDDESWVRAARRECAEEAGLDLQTPLRWFDTWITPSGEVSLSPSGGFSRRFVARFFLARLRPDEGTEAAADGAETMHGRWATVEAHLDAWRSGSVDLPPPTLCTLLRLQALGWHGHDRLFEHDPRPPILPKMTTDGDAALIVMPHDPEYPALPGEGAPAPSRVAGLPQRFRRGEHTWLVV